MNTPSNEYIDLWTYNILGIEHKCTFKKVCRSTTTSNDNSGKLITVTCECRIIENVYCPYPLDKFAAFIKVHIESPIAVNNGEWVQVPLITGYNSSISLEDAKHSICKHLADLSICHGLDGIGIWNN